MARSDVDFVERETYGESEITPTSSVKVRRVDLVDSAGNAKPKVSIQNFWVNKEGDENPGKGIFLDPEVFMELFPALESAYEDCKSPPKKVPAKRGDNLRSKKVPAKKGAAPAKRVMRRKVSNG